MTWVVGIVGTWAGAIAASDLRITFPDEPGRFEDCLQKLYLVGANGLIGFSGSVRFGMRARDALILELVGHRSMKREKVAVQQLTDKKIEKWQRGLPALWQEVTRGRCRLMLMICRPNPPQKVQEPDGRWRLARAEDRLPPPKPRTAGFTLESPEFNLEPMPAQEPVSIGSGSGNPVWQARIARLGKWDYFGLAQDEFAAAPALPLSILIEEAMRESQRPDVSPEVQIAVLGPRGVTYLGARRYDLLRDMSQLAQRFGSAADDSIGRAVDFDSSSLTPTTRGTDYSGLLKVAPARA